MNTAQLPQLLPNIAQRIARELNAQTQQINAAVTLMDEGATVPFIARYRKEATGGLDDTQLRRLEERLVYLRDLEERRITIAKEIHSLGKLDAALRQKLATAETKQRLEDLYLPYKVKRRTHAEIAKEAGLEALVDQLMADPSLSPETCAAAYLCAPFKTDAGDNPGVADPKAALEGASTILISRFSQDADLLTTLRELLWQQGVLVSQVMKDQAEQGAKFRDYFDFSQALAKVPPHRALALFRGRAENILRLSLKMPEELESTGWQAGYGPCEERIAAHFQIHDSGRPADAWLANAVRLSWRTKLSFTLEAGLFSELQKTAEEEAIRVFAQNLQDLLLAAPAGNRATLGLDPGIRTGVKVAVVDGTGKLLETTTIYPFAPKNDVTGSVRALQTLAQKHAVELVAIGNGTGSRETEQLVNQLKIDRPELGLIPVVVSEAGASVYSASEFAAREFPQLDVSLRGAVSIARRLQDPLAELVKIEPKAIGVGQYQHDVSQTYLSRALDSVVEDCVNRVGVDLNTASAPLLSRIAGLSAGLAENVVALRDAQGRFKRREELLKVPRLGPKAFEQAAGFLRIPNGENPLDASAVHPEAYPLVQRMLSDLNAPIEQVMHEPKLLKTVDPQRYTDAQFGLPTIQDILTELEKPGRDPRPQFKTATFKEGVNDLKDLAPDMILEGVVTNVTNFGAFVDIGVHQDGLVHISALADKFVKDPHDVVRAGDIVRVKVMEIDVPRKRISLTMRMDSTASNSSREAPAKVKSAQKDRGRNSKNRGRRTQSNQHAKTQQPRGAMAQAFAKARKQ